MKTFALVLAAGKGTRMKSDIAKGAFLILDKPMIDYVVERFENSKYVTKTVLIVGHKKEYFYERFKDRVLFAEQLEQKGTAHAVKSALHLLEDEGQTIIVPGDVPLMSQELTDKIIETHINEKNDLTVSTMIVEDPFGYGRIIRDSKKNIKKIVEQKNATQEELKINEVNTGIYVVNNKVLKEELKKIEENSLTKEYYLTDLVEVMYSKYKIGSFLIEDSWQTYGINDNKQASIVEDYLRNQINDKHMLNGVTMESPSTIRISQDAIIEPGVTIKQNTIIIGKSTVKKGSVIGPNTTINDSKIDEDVIVEDSVIKYSAVGKRSYLGPFAYIRDGAVIGEEVRIGNYTEVKNSTIGNNTLASHHTYIGDAKVGARVNFGCGSITVNYDGKDKFRTIIGDDVFVGCNVNLIAPLKIADKAFLAAGSTITEDVEEGALAIGRSRQENKKDFYYRHFNVKKK